MRKNKKTFLRESDHRQIIFKIIAIAALVILVIFSYFLTRAMNDPFTLSQGEWLPPVSSDVVSGSRNLITDKYGYISSETDITTDPSLVQLGDTGIYIRWGDNGATVVNEANSQSEARTISDNGDGLIVVWQDDRNNLDPMNPIYDIYIQKMNRSCYEAGVHESYTCWHIGADYSGIPLTFGVPNSYPAPQIVSDNSGGAIITWTDDRTGLSLWDIYAQMVDASGVPQWAVGGIPVSNVLGPDQYNYASGTDSWILPDGSGGAIATWYDTRGANNDIYAQRINKTCTGDPLIVGDHRCWINPLVAGDYNGILISGQNSNESSPLIVTDSTGGAIIVWENDDSYDIYAQKINESCMGLNAGDYRCWEGGNGYKGIPISMRPGSQDTFQVTSDGSGGAIVAWQGDDNVDFIYDIYAQKINESCLGLAGPNDYRCWDNGINFEGMPVSVIGNSGAQNYPEIISDDLGGAIIEWQDDGNLDTVFDVYAERLLGTDGGPQMSTGGGILVSANAGYNVYPKMTSDGSGGAIISWQEDANLDSNYDVFVQRVNMSCDLANNYRCWHNGGDYNGIIASNPLSSVGSFPYPYIISDNTGGAFITFLDDSGVTGKDIYVQRMDKPDYETYSELESVVFDAMYYDYETTINSITWDTDDTTHANLPPNTSLEILMRTADHDVGGVPAVPTDILTESWFSVLTLTSVDTPNTATPLPTPFIANRYFQYKLILRTGDVSNTPTLDSIIFTGNSQVAPISPTIDLFSSDLNSINTGECVVLSWDLTTAASQNLDSCTITSNPVGFIKNINLADPGSFPTGSTAPSEVCPLSSTTYTLTCTNPDSDYGDYGVVVSSGSQSSAIDESVTVIVPASGNPPTYSPPEEEIVPPPMPPIPPTPSAPIAEVIPQGCNVALDQFQLSPIPIFPEVCGNSNWWGTRVQWALEHRANIYNLYGTLLKRNPCSIEVNWWFERYCDINNIRKGMMNSIEYKSKYGI